MGLQNELYLLSFLVTVTGVLGGDYCYDVDTGTSQWCSYGCCGYLDGDCCDANVALIVGLTVLSILIVSTIIAVACCCARRRAAAGQVIQTNPGPGLIVTTAQTTTMSSNQPMAYPTQGYQPGVYAPQPYPMGQQYPPAHPYGAPATQPLTGAMGPPPYTQEPGGHVNPGFDYKPLN